MTAAFLLKRAIQGSLNKVSTYIWWEKFVDFLISWLDATNENSYNINYKEFWVSYKRSTTKLTNCFRFFSLSNYIIFLEKINWIKQYYILFLGLILQYYILVYAVVNKEKHRIDHDRICNGTQIITMAITFRVMTSDDTMVFYVQDIDINE